ncbi:MAG: GAF domain-containing protein, partial [Desulfuromonadales bacterium]|nr:GAF domain-containing protein [Desulfuromonadales bacterium]NIS40267.1 GAF domain-containing protein [Desulfuromonadales bacterium]
QKGQGITGSVAESGLPEFVNDPLSDPRVSHTPGTDRREDEREAIIFAPLKVRETVIGVMIVWRDRIDTGVFTRSDLDFATNLANQAAIAIQ